MDILKTPIPQSVLDTIDGYINNSIDNKVASGVYVVRLNGGIDRFDNISDTPIQDAINSAVALSTGVGDYVWCNNWNGYAIGKMEQNIVLKNYINMRFDGGNIFSDSTDDTPLFTDSGTRASIVITGNPILGRYGGTGDNNRCVFKLEHANSFIRSNSYMVIDSTNGSQNSIISNGNLYLGGDNTIVGNIKIINGVNFITSNRGTNTLVVSGGDLTFNGECVQISKSGTGTLNYIGTNNLCQKATVGGGSLNVNNVYFQEKCIQTSGTSVFTSCSFNAVGDNSFLITSTSGSARFNSCRFETDDSYNLEISASGTSIVVDNCKFVNAGDNSIYSPVAVNVINYNSYATINKNSNVTLLVNSALTVSADVI